MIIITALAEMADKSGDLFELITPLDKTIPQDRAKEFLPQCVSHRYIPNQFLPAADRDYFVDMMVAFGWEVRTSVVGNGIVISIWTRG